MSEYVRIETDENGVDWLVVESIIGTLKQRCIPLEVEPRERFFLDDPVVFRRRFLLDDQNKSLSAIVYSVPLP